MRALLITDLANAMSDVLGRSAVDVVKTGLRPGEKLYEELISAEERPRTVDLERLLVILPADENVRTIPDLRTRYDGAARVQKDWNSSHDTRMSRDEIARYLRDHEILEPFLRPGGIIPDRDSVPGF
jgi:FlaA1/EpsC-like NDP-sugar epimerase